MIRDIITPAERLYPPERCRYSAPDWVINYPTPPLDPREIYPRPVDPEWLAKIFALPVGDMFAWQQPVTTTASKLADAVRYLRERGRYYLDRPVARLPAPERPLSLLDRWIATRRAA